jgi:transposase-like protein
MEDDLVGQRDLVRSEGGIRATDQPVHALPDSKLRAVEMLVAGVRPGMVAKNLGVSRETLWRWRQEAAFRRHLQRLRVELHVSRIDRTWQLVDRSLDVVELHLEEGSLDAAKTILRLAGLRTTELLPDGPSDEPRSQDEDE